MGFHKFLENFKPSYGVFSSALGAETSDKVESALFMKMDKYRNSWGLAGASGVASGSVVTLQLLEATASDGSGSATISGKTDTFTAGATSETDLLQAEVKAEELTSGYAWVGIRVSTNNESGTEQVFGVLVQGDARYPQNSLP